MRIRGGLGDAAAEGTPGRASVVGARPVLPEAEMDRIKSGKALSVAMATREPREMTLAEKSELVMQMLAGIPEYDETGNEIGRGPPLISTEEACLLMFL